VLPPSGKELDGMRRTEPDGAGQTWTLEFRFVAAVNIVVADVAVAVQIINLSDLDGRRCSYDAPP
jgi:hypothetical protein